ncbi:hypothetical protein E2562_020517 [Oryza meyeriana var. granulata]|uniref:Uncharacterized protein n=1 Tax=Oryza meyeriana var. granulata TaxID=110450 RepID=A0A6G1EAZ1_9ORYZ|nr:hypothetical protein E2562_020517 [Oryza meyeriana var. granulata]
MHQPDRGTRRLSDVEEDHGEKVAFDGDGQYKKMVNEQPGNAEFLRNYSQFLREVFVTILTGK